MTTAFPEPDDPAAAAAEPADDLSIVPGLGPSGPLDVTQDPGRSEPARSEPARSDPAAVAGPLDRSRDPDRYRPPGQGQTLTDLLGEGAHEGSRDNGQWAFGLLAVIAFLALVSWLFGSVLSPR